MNKLIGLLLICSVTTTSLVGVKYNGSTTAAVTLAGAIIKAKHVEPIQKKYKRKDCPVCKGKGWYVSGDDIAKVACGYCEPEEGQTPTTPKTIIKRR